MAVSRLERARQLVDGRTLVAAGCVGRRGGKTWCYPPKLNMRRGGCQLVIFGSMVTKKRQGQAGGKSAPSRERNCRRPSERGAQDGEVKAGLFRALRAPRRRMRALRR